MPIQGAGASGRADGGVSRRDFLGGLFATAVVVGFDPVGRRWATAADAVGCATFHAAPQLDGELTMDPASRQAVATDKGNIVHRMPCAVLRPGSVEDIAEMIRFCRRHDIPVSTRGQAHTTHGHSLSSGLVIESRHLGRIHSIGPDRAEVDTGIQWMDLVQAAYAQDPKLTPPVLTGYTQLTVGGTLSVGGIGGLVGGLDTGLQVDHVQELEVVTGTGRIQRCSREHNRDLFEAMLGGLGQCGVMTRATIDLVPARERARTYSFQYLDNATFFRDMRTMINRPGVDHVYTQWFPPGTTTLVYQMNATVFYDLSSPPDDLRLTAGLSTVPLIQDTTYLDWVFLIDEVIGVLEATIDWDRLVKPWFDVWLPDSTVEQYVGEVLPKLRPADVGAGGFVLLFPQRRALATRPFVRLPEPDGSEWVFLFDILTSSNTPTPDPDFIEEMLDRNDALFARARDHFGGVRYPIGSKRFDQSDWQDHYGEAWQSFLARKRRFDPGGILARGLGIFT